MGNISPRHEGPLTPVEIVIIVYIICVPVILSIVTYENHTKILTMNRSLFPDKFSLFPLDVCIYERDLQRKRHLDMTINDNE